MPRRVVTGVDAEGRSRLRSDEEVASKSIPNTLDMYDLWGSDERVLVPNPGKLPPYTNVFPPPQGFRVCITQIQPDSVLHSVDVDPAVVGRQLREEFPGLLDSFDPDVPGMHSTQTVDIGIVLSGEVWLELDDRERILLREGDVSVQNGNRHAWRNTSDAPCRIAWAIIGGASNEGFDGPGLTLLESGKAVQSEAPAGAAVGGVPRREDQRR